MWQRSANALTICVKGKPCVCLCVRRRAVIVKHRGRVEMGGGSASHISWNMAQRKKKKSNVRTSPYVQIFLNYCTECTVNHGDAVFSVELYCKLLVDRLFLVI